MRATKLSLSSAFTYSLGKSLYVPITSRCNSFMLPQTRGPNFLLPPKVVATLCRFRDAEHSTEQWHHWCMYLDTQELPTKLPDPYERVAQLDTRDGDATGNDVDDDDDDNDDDGRQPSIAAIQEAIQEQLRIKDYDSIVLAGEGEPTLRWKALLEIAKRFSSEKEIRLTTNGLIQAENACQELKENGVKAVSVALMTADPLQYKLLMDPLLPLEGEASPHHVVCNFVQQAIDCQLQVELTGVDRPDVDKAQAEELAASLGVDTAMRWRPFFP